MMLSSYLSPSRHGVYYFRWPLPTLEGEPRRTVRISLRTRCHVEAGDLARHLASCGRLLRENKALAGLRQDEIRTKVQAFFRAQLDEYLAWLDRRTLSPGALSAATEEMYHHECFVEFESTHPQFLPIARFKRTMHVSNEDWDASLPRILIELRKGRRDVLKAVLEAVEKLQHYSYEDKAPLTAAIEPAELSKSSPLGAAVKDFIDEHSRQWATKTVGQNEAYLNILIEYFGSDRELATITKHDASEVKKVLQALPSSRNTKPKLKGRPLMEVIAEPGHAKISAKTINSHIQMFKCFFDWAERHGHSPHTLFDGMKVPKEKNSENERKPFTQEQTRRIYKELTENTSRFVRNESHKWGSLLGLFTGARLNEICQLDVADVQQEDGIHFLNISDEGDKNKRIKSKAGRRKVPIHPELIRLGFLDFVDSRCSGNRLFPDYSYSPKGGYGKNLGHWFNASFLPKLGFKAPGVVFHCLRHTMVTRLAQAGVAEPLYQEIVGHERQGVTQQNYFKEGHTLVQKLEALQRFVV